MTDEFKQSEQQSTTPSESSDNQEESEGKENISTISTPKTTIRPLPFTMKGKPADEQEKKIEREEKANRTKFSRRSPDPPEQQAKKPRMSPETSPTLEVDDDEIIIYDEVAPKANEATQSADSAGPNGQNQNFFEMLVNQLMNRNDSIGGIQVQMAKMVDAIKELKSEVHSTVTELSEHTKILAIHGKRADEWMRQINHSSSKSENLLDRYDNHSKEWKKANEKMVASIESIKDNVTSLCTTVPKIEGILLGTGRSEKPLEVPRTPKGTQQSTSLRTNQESDTSTKPPKVHCLFCNKTNHKSEQCRNHFWYLKRKERLQKLGRCFKCLEVSADSSTHEGCKEENTKCQHCVALVATPEEANHHMWLCPLKFTEVQAIPAQKKKGTGANAIDIIPKDGTTPKFFNT